MSGCRIQEAELDDISMMDAISIVQPGGPDMLQLETRPVPHPGEGEILIEVAAAGVNRPDILQRIGVYPPPAGAPDIPGLEVSGRVSRVGRNVSRWREGDIVVALVPGGGYAAYCVVHDSNALPLPAGLSKIEGAGLPETTFTVWHNVFQRGGLRPGETLLVHGGTSGIGTTAIQIARAFDATVITTAGSDAKCRAAEKLGAHAAINYNNQDYVQAVDEITGGRGADVILDMVGGDYIERNYEAAAMDGRIVQIAFLNGPIADVNFSKLMMKRLTHTGSTLRARSVAFKAELARELEEIVWPLIAKGRYRPVMDKTFPLEAAEAAHMRMEHGTHIGKIILTVDEVD
jgi:putative PIG3 family NAD(P)H quinone oxidoreductase